MHKSKLQEIERDRWVCVSGVARDDIVFRVFNVRLHTHKRAYVRNILIDVSCFLFALKLKFYCIETRNRTLFYLYCYAPLVFRTF